jgi:hypothetical protein
MVLLMLLYVLPALVALSVRTTCVALSLWPCVFLSFHVVLHFEQSNCAYAVPVSRRNLTHGGLSCLTPAAYVEWRAKGSSEVMLPCPYVAQKIWSKSGSWWRYSDPAAGLEWHFDPLPTNLLTFALLARQEHQLAQQLQAQGITPPYSKGDFTSHSRSRGFDGVESLNTVAPNASVSLGLGVGSDAELVRILAMTAYDMSKLVCRESQQEDKAVLNDSPPKYPSLSNVQQALRKLLANIASLSRSCTAERWRHIGNALLDAVEGIDCANESHRMRLLKAQEGTRAASP